MRCNTISFVSRLIRKCFMRDLLGMFEDVCSLHTCFSADSFRLLCCVMPCECSGCFFCATRYIALCKFLEVRVHHCHYYMSYCEWCGQWTSLSSCFPSGPWCDHTLPYHTGCVAEVSQCWGHHGAVFINIWLQICTLHCCLTKVMFIFQVMLHF